MHPQWCFSGLAASVLLLTFAAAQPPSAKPVVAGDPPREALLATARIKLPEGLKAELFAAEPLLANPVAFCFDEQGRIYVAETFRLHDGVTDNRSHMDWLDDDLACRTVADRDALYHKHLQGKYDTFTRATDRVRLLIDSNGRGRPDTSYVFSADYHRAVDGLGSGLLVHDGHVYYTCIPDLWRLRDSRGTNQADVRESLSSGYGVHTSFIGHDLHGLVVSPVDGKIYFSIGDRGTSLVTKEHRRIDLPDTGAVFRCNPNGTELEWFARGLRNPQELAFDDLGNLFTGDNNSDSGDRARFVYLPEGADCGWHIGFQYLEQTYSRGPWNAEFMWHPPRKDQPAFIVPPITNLGDGPSGLVYYPGTGLSERYRNHFFLADFRGSTTGSGIRSFAVKPKGAGFELIDSQQFAWGVLATDVDFGPDGALYILDWVEGWGLTGKGRIHRVFDPSHTATAGAKVKALLTSNWSSKSDAELGNLLGHEDRRVRMQAQFTLVKRGDTARRILEDCARQGQRRNTRLHAIWGLGQRMRSGEHGVESLLTSLVHDEDPAVIVNALRVLGTSEMKLHYSDYEFLFHHGDDQVKAQAAICLGKQKVDEALPALLELIKTSKLRDPWLRHACAMGLTPFLVSQEKQLTAAGKEDCTVRLAVVLADRHLDKSPVTFLHDNDPSVRDEAIRACHDLLGRDALAAVANVSIVPDMREQIQLRILNAHLHRGSEGDAKSVAAYAGKAAMPIKVRIEAVKMLAAWEKPSGRDWVIGRWRPVPGQRSAAPARKALADVFPPLLLQKNRLAAAAIEASGALGISSLESLVLEVIGDRSFSAEARVAAIEAAAALKTDHLTPAVKTALNDPDSRVRSAAQRELVKLNPREAVAHLQRALEHGELRERQAIFDQLAGMNRPEADQLLETWLTRFSTGDVPAELQLDLVRAARKRSRPGWKVRVDTGLHQLAKAGPYAEHRLTLAGGDREAGRRIFFEKTAVACLRCHRIGKDGGEVGPELTHIGREKSREYLLEAIVDPNKNIAKGFELSILLTQDGVIHQGVVKKETATEVTIITPEAKTEVIKKADIEERKTGKSAMPEDVVKQLNLREMRDLIEYLSRLK